MSRFRHINDMIIAVRGHERLMYVDMGWLDDDNLGMWHRGVIWELIMNKGHRIKRVHFIDDYTGDKALRKGLQHLYKLGYAKKDGHSVVLGHRIDKQYKHTL